MKHAKPLTRQRKPQVAQTNLQIKLDFLLSSFDSILVIVSNLFGSGGIG